MNDLKYEDKQEDLDCLLRKYRVKWQLDSISWLDYDDVCQMIRLHIFKKWHLWDQSRPFGPWAAMIISNQIKNLIRNYYSNYAKPCIRCPHYSGGDSCSLNKSGVQDESCGLFAKWKKKKEVAYNLKLPISLDEGFLFLGNVFIEDNINYEKSQKKLNDLIRSSLNKKHSEIYAMLYIENASESEVAQIYNFKPDSANRKTVRYKQITNLRKKFYEIACSIIKNHDIL